MSKSLQFVSLFILSVFIVFSFDFAPEAHAEITSARGTTKSKKCGKYGRDPKTKQCRTLTQYCNTWAYKNRKVCKKSDTKEKRSKKKKTTRAKTSTKSLHSPSLAKSFISQCKKNGINAKLCTEMVSPNKNSKRAFNAVYGSKTPHFLIPNKNKWKLGMDLLKIAQKTRGICQIANWFRPEPYNRRVGGARRSNHRDASAIDIHYCSRSARNKALKKFKQIEKRTRKLGIGTYSGKGSVTIHIDFATRNYHQ